MGEEEGIVLFYPNVPKTAIEEVTKVLQGRWIGQGPRVAQFEKEFAQKSAGRVQPWRLVQELIRCTSRIFLQV
jgi:hypothetical protein